MIPDFKSRKPTVVSSHNSNQLSMRMCTNYSTLVASHEKDYKFHKLYAIDCIHLAVFKTIHYSARLQKHTLE